MIYKITTEHLERMCLPRLYWQAKLAEIPESCPHKKYIQKYVESIKSNVQQGLGLLLHGDYGGGKTGISSIILKAAATNGYIGLWLRAPNLARAIMTKEMFDKKNTVWERACEVPILVVDELIIYNDNRDPFIEDLLRERINNQRATIITTNLNPNDIKMHFPALAAVMKEALFPIKVSGHNFRDSLAKEIQDEFQG